MAVKEVCIIIYVTDSEFFPSLDDLKEFEVIEYYKTGERINKGANKGKVAIENVAIFLGSFHKIIDFLQSNINITQNKKELNLELQIAYSDEPSLVISSKDLFSLGKMNVDLNVSFYKKEDNDESN